MAIKIPIFADYNDRGVKNAEASFSKFGRNVGKIMKTGALAIGGLAVATAAIATKLVLAAENAATANARISQIATSMNLFGAGTENAGTSVKELTDRLTNLAEKMAMATGIDQNQIKLTQAKLLTFKNLATTADEVGGAFDRATRAAIDMAAAGFGDAASNAVQLGKALQDPVKGITALSRSGITFTAVEKDLIASLVKTGKAGEAQAMILKAIESQVGGTAETTANASAKMRVAFSILQEKLGTKLLPTFEKLSKFLINKVIPGVEKFSDLMSQKGLAGVLDLVKRQLPNLQAAFSSLWQWITNVGVPKFLALMQSMGKALVDWIGPRIMPMLKKLGELVGKAANWIYEVGLPALTDKLILLGDAFVAWITPLIGPMLKKLGELFKVVATWLLTVGAPALVKAAVKLSEALIRWVSEIAGPLLKGLGLMLIDIGKWVFTDGIPALAKLGVQLGAGLINALVGALKGLALGGLDVGRAFANGIIDFINRNVIDKINALFEFTIDPPGPGPTFTINPPDLGHIPRLAAGGIVTRPTLAMIGESGREAVIPLTGRNAGMGMGGVTNYITINTLSDPQSVVQALQQFNRMNGPIPINTRAA